jgi:zinc/manganese transport system permease protein
MALATFFALLSCSGGLLVSYHANLPSGPAIVVIAGCLYGACLLASTLRSRRTRPVRGST